MNHLVTGPPRSGKTTVIERTVERLPPDLTVGGLYSPELRDDGNRIGFDLVDVATDERVPMARIDRESGPAVGKYRVDVAAVDEAAHRSLTPARTDAAVVVVDEIAPMQLTSERFVDELRKTLAAPVPLLGAIADRSDGPYDKITSRVDTTTYVVTDDTREALPDRLVRVVTEAN